MFVRVQPMTSVWPNGWRFGLALVGRGQGSRIDRRQWVFWRAGTGSSGLEGPLGEKLGQALHIIAPPAEGHEGQLAARRARCGREELEGSCRFGSTRGPLRKNS